MGTSTVAFVKPFEALNSKKKQGCFILVLDEPTPNIKSRVIVPFKKLWKLWKYEQINAMFQIDSWNALDRRMATAICKTPLTLLTSQIFLG